MSEPRPREKVVVLPSARLGDRGFHVMRRAVRRWRLDGMGGLVRVVSLRVRSGLGARMARLSRRLQRPQSREQVVARFGQRAAGWLHAASLRLAAGAVPVLCSREALLPAAVPAGAAPSGPARAVGAVVVAYNSAACLGDCLSALKRTQETTPGVRLAVRVVDNNSTDGTRAILSSWRQEWPSLEVIEPGKNLGFGPAINLAMRDWRVDDLLLVNPDTLLTPQALAALLAEAERTRDSGFRAWEARQFPYEHPKVYDPVTLETEWVSGACCLIDAAAFRQVGGFDPNIFLYAEDVDLSWRLRSGGYRLRYVPRAVVEHRTYEHPGQIKPSQFFHGIVSNGVLRHKYGNALELAAYYLRWGRCLLNPPLPQARRRLVADLARNIPRFLRAWIARHRHPRPTPEVGFRPRFAGWDYEVRRTGAFYPVALPDQTPLVSIIVRTKDRPSFLSEALASLRNQTYPRLEVVVVEDGPPLSAGIITRFPELNLVYLPLGRSQGRCRAGNHGLERARGEFCGFLDDDDLLFADHVEVLIRALLDQPECRLAYSVGFEVQTLVVKTEPFTYVEGPYGVAFRQPFDRELLGKQNLFPINAAVFDRTMFLSAGGLDPEFELLEDWDLWLRYARETDFAFVDKTTFLYRVPLDPAVAADRQAELVRHADRIRTKHSGLESAQGRRHPVPTRIAGASVPTRPHRKTPAS
jgi:GT2 family glycosyltransferase